MSASGRDDPSTLGELVRDDRRRVANVCESRARGEQWVSACFALITHDLIDLGAPGELLELAASAVSEELLHAHRWLEVASQYAGEERTWPAAGRLDLPTYPGAPPELVPALRVVGMSCMNETIATVRLREIGEQVVVPQLRAALRAILADEVKHARLGWAYLASNVATADIKRALPVWLPTLLEANLGSLFADVAGVDARLRAHGIPSEADTRRVAAAAVRELVLPGFDQVGVDTRPARAWVAEHLPPGP